MAIYLDHAASTAMSEPALAAYLQAAKLGANPSSLHGAGRGTRNQLELAREEIADLLGAYPSEIIFTAGATEANNLAIKGQVWATKKRALITSSVEHHSILDPAEWLQENGIAEHLFCSVDSDGFLNLPELAKLQSERADDLALIAVMAANNETGAIQDLAGVVAAAGEIPVHADLAQFAGVMDFDFAASGLQSAALSAHKIGGPVGVGALLLARGEDLTPLLHGGGQERDLRSGTINAAGAISFAAALRDRVENRAKINQEIARMRQQLKVGLSTIPGTSFNTPEPALPGILNVTFDGTLNEATLLMLDRAGIFASAGSACTAGVNRPSHVLLAMGRSEEMADASIRFSIGVGNSEAEIAEVVELMPEIIEFARAAFISSKETRESLRR